LQTIFQDPGSSLNPRRTIESQILDGISASGPAAGPRICLTEPQLRRVNADLLACHRIGEITLEIAK
jgi:ABC-type dipeptide/oligopeptide/nickel transport system ATPase subunit